MRRSVFLVSSLLLLVAACSDSTPQPSVDGGADSGEAADSAVLADASTSDLGVDGDVAFSDGGVFSDGDTDAPLLSCVDTCGDGRCETRIRLRSQCLQGEAEMSTCTQFVADFACHDAGIAP